MPIQSARTQTEMMVLSMVRSVRPKKLIALDAVNN